MAHGNAHPRDDLVGEEIVLVVDDSRQSGHAEALQLDLRQAEAGTDVGRHASVPAELEQDGEPAGLGFDLPGRCGLTHPVQRVKIDVICA